MKRQRFIVRSEVQSTDMARCGAVVDNPKDDPAHSYRNAALRIRQRIVERKANAWTVGPPPRVHLPNQTRQSDDERQTADDAAVDLHPRMIRRSFRASHSTYMETWRLSLAPSNLVRRRCPASASRATRPASRRSARPCGWRSTWPVCARCPRRGGGSWSRRSRRTSPRASRWAAAAPWRGPCSACWWGSGGAGWRRARPLGLGPHFEALLAELRLSGRPI
jgi:hypothetical protein